MLVDKSFAKALQIPETYVLVDNNLWGKCVWSLELSITFDKMFKITSVITFIVLYWVMLYWYYIKAK